MLGAEPVDDLLERRVAAELEAVPERPVDAVVRRLLGRDRLREAEEGQRDVEERVLEVVDLGLAVDELRVVTLA